MVFWHSFVGVAPGEAAQSRGDGVGSGSSSAQALQTAIKTRVVSTGRQGGPSRTKPASGETSERRLGAYQARSSPGGKPGAPYRCSLADGFPKRRTRTIEEAQHPTAFASRIVILTHRLAGLRRSRRCLCAALGDLQVATLIASLQLSTQPQFHANRLVPHPGVRLFARDLVALAGKRKRVVVGDDTLLDVAQNRRQVQLRRQRTMVIRKIGHWFSEALV